MSFAKRTLLRPHLDMSTQCHIVPMCITDGA